MEYIEIGGVAVNIKRVNMKMLPGLLVTIILILAIGLRAIVNFVTDFQWFSQNEFLSTFLAKILTELGILVPLWVIAGFGLHLYIKELKKKYYAQAHIDYDKQADKGIELSMGIFSAVFAGALRGQ